MSGATQVAGSAGTAPVPSWSAEDLTGGGPVARITLGDSNYVLRITRAGKLILTK